MSNQVPGATILPMDTLEEDWDSLPPITPTPRSAITGQPHPVTPRPYSSRISNNELITTQKPRRSLKQVSRGHRQWTSGLLDCMDDTRLCCFTCICPCVTMWTVADRTEENCCIAWLPWATVAMRTRIRTLGGIKGSIARDYLVSCFCPLLTICQMARETDSMIVRPEEFVKPVL